MEEIEFDFGYLKQLTKWNDTNSLSFAKTLDSMYKKLININFKIGNNVRWTRFVLFTKYTIDTENQNISIGINQEFKWVLNEIAKNFTRFELEEFVNFKSSYTK
ncbi:replication initiation protein, partial [Streptobacillus moniliformis]|uniref:replication initiation protein n=1 Tax=Streptobacillus moniliformis TaxID=34105 RepID=UPI001E3602A2